VPTVHNRRFIPLMKFACLSVELCPPVSTCKKRVRTYFHVAQGQLHASTPKCPEEDQLFLLQVQMKAES